MENKIKALLLIAALCFSANSNAQFWKKLKKRAEEAAKETVAMKVEEKTARETEKTFDSVFNNKGKLFQGKKVAPSENYSFTHIYEMAIVSDKDTMPITYYLTNSGKYMGFSSKIGKGQQMLTVLDASKKTAYLFMEMGGKKTITSMPLDFEEAVEEEKDMNAAQVTATGRAKDILGYSCSEYEVISDDFEGAIWVTQDADITFSNAFDTLKQKRKSKGPSQNVLKLIDGLTLEMDMTDTSKKNPKPVKMICTSLLKSDFTIDTSQYQK